MGPKNKNGPGAQQEGKELTMKFTKSIGRMIIAGGALLTLLAVVGAQPL